MNRPNAWCGSVALSPASFAKATTLTFIGLVGISVLLLAETAEATPIPPVNSVHIQIVNTNAGRVMTAHAERYANKVYLNGRVFRPMSVGIGAHVHVWGLYKNNQQVFLRTSYVFFTGRPSLEHTETYQVSVSPEIFAKAKTIFVTFHSQGDDQSNTEDY
jgi:hypothetical protein